MSDLGWKRTIDYYALKSIRLEHENAALKFDVDRLNAAIEHLMLKPPKKFANQFVVFKGDDLGNYHSPIIVDADSPEEALCPEGNDEPRGDYCQRLSAPSEYKDI